MSVLKALMLWTGAFLIFFGMAMCLFGIRQYHQSLDSHFSGGLMRFVRHDPVLSFSWRVFGDHLDGVFLAELGIVLCFWNRTFSSMTFPIVHLVTLLLVFAWHKPWWSYYYVHFSVPLAWLGSYALKALVSSTSEAGCGDLQTKPRNKLFATCIAVALGTAITLGGFRRVIEWHKEAVLAETCGQSALLQAIKRYRGKTNWMISNSAIYAFHARLMMPAELGVLPPKRFWSGQLSSRDVFSAAARYQPEQILLFDFLNDWRMLPDWERLLTERYDLIFEHRGYSLYLAKAINGNVTGK